MKTGKIILIACFGIFTLFPLLAHAAGVKLTRIKIDQEGKTNYKCEDNKLLFQIIMLEVFRMFNSKGLPSINYDCLHKIACVDFESGKSFFDTTILQQLTDSQSIKSEVQYEKLTDLCSENTSRQLDLLKYLYTIEPTEAFSFQKKIMPIIEVKDKKNNSKNTISILFY
jgi:hypothetical protein